MSKEPAKGNDDVIAKIKAEEEAKKKASEEANSRARAAAAEAEAKEQARIKAEQEKLDPDADKKPENPELAKAAADAAAKIEQAEKDANDVPVAEDSPQMDRDNRQASARHAKSRNAAEKLRLIALSYPLTTPDEHVIFGFGGHKYTLGDLRDLTNIR